MNIPFLNEDQINDLVFIRQQQAEHEIDILVDASLALGIEEEELNALSELTLALDKVEDIFLIANNNGVTVIERAGLAEKELVVSNRAPMKDLIVVVTRIKDEKAQKGSFFGSVLVPLRVFNYSKLKASLSIKDATGAFGKYQKGE